MLDVQYTLELPTMVAGALVTWEWDVEARYEVIHDPGDRNNPPYSDLDLVELSLLLMDNDRKPIKPILVPPEELRKLEIHAMEMDDRC